MTKKFDELQQAILVQLKRDFPNLSEEELKTQSSSIATKQWKNVSKEKVKTTSDGKIIVGENVKLIIEANITASGMIEE